ncbi:MAG: pyrroline-5-carboxylate reductase [Nitrospinae bacterium CG11_big_fil_rev_8_21_14_0_20_45_15]|nr:MAG: pyrroline-5-carboxylate reductase [Nitrospinae bacterium CG11_big_fil_rev_8_21_14_0_20_45_15]
MLSKKRIGFIGGGNMAEAIVKGLVASKSVASKNILIADVSSERLNFLRKEYKVETASNNKDVTEKSDIVILAVKPQIMDKVLEEMRDIDLGKKLLISVAAGYPILAIESILKSDQEKKKVRVIRTMPNTPALVLEGATAITPGTDADKNDLKMAHFLFSSVGKTVDVTEKQIDAVTGLSGSGPAYIFMIIEALADGGVKMGLSRDVANTLSIQTVLGAAKLAQQSGLHPGELKDRVASPGGTTIAGIHALESGALRATLMDAVEAAAIRSEELGQ